MIANGDKPLAPSGRLRRSDAVRDMPDLDSSSATMPDASEGEEKPGQRGIGDFPCAVDSYRALHPKMKFMPSSLIRNESNAPSQVYQRPDRKLRWYGGQRRRYHLEW